MSLIRTRLAFERTSMSWARTAVSLITFGFTLYKAFVYLEHHCTSRARDGLVTARHFATGMLGIGLVALLLVLVQLCRHVAVLRELDSELPIISVGLIVTVPFTGLGIWGAGGHSGTVMGRSLPKASQE